MINILFSSIKDLFNLKEETIKALKRLEIINFRDLLFYKPLSFQVKNTSPILANLESGQLIQTEVEIVEISKSSKIPIKILVENNTGQIMLVFFNKIPPFIFNKLKVGSLHIICGKVQYFENYYQITHPEFILSKKHETNVEALYSLTYGITNKQLCSYILNGIKILEKSLINFPIKQKEYLNELLNQLKILHFCEKNAPSIKSWNENIELLALKELIANQAHLFKVRTQKQIKNGFSFLLNKSLQNIIIDKLGFELTDSQIKTIEEIEKDQQSHFQMMRLLQGDVGSGKTIVALLTMVNVVFNNYQVALMAPTDLLANQHYQFFKTSLEETSFNVELLTGKTTQKQRKILQKELIEGTIDILIGTHALFQDKVIFKNLGYIVVDEQHKFGVEQRLQLINKSTNPDVLIMTATPIPRSLTLTVFGDMEVSKMTCKPKNRQPIITTCLPITKIESLISSLPKKLHNNEKIYWICPLIDQSDKIQEEGFMKYADTVTRFKSINEIYPGIVGLLHGKMSGDEKDHIMQEFKKGKFEILISTTVIEVGIDVGEATLIIIENAEKFGLAQLHQLRGRVGRGHLQSHCILLYNAKCLSNEAKQRLEIMKTSNDGFYIAEQDMLLRGSGELLGTKQSGEPKFFFADLKRDLSIVTEANNYSKKIKIDEFINFQIKLFARGNEGLISSG